jgi:hypothetical protein
LAIAFAQNYSVAEHHVGGDQTTSVSSDYLGAKGWLLCGGVCTAEGDATWLVNAQMQNAQALCGMCTAEVEEYCELLQFKSIPFFLLSYCSTIFYIVTTVKCENCMHAADCNSSSWLRIGNGWFNYFNIVLGKSCLREDATFDQLLADTAEIATELDMDKMKTHRSVRHHSDTLEMQQDMLTRQCENTIVHCIPYLLILQFNS